MTDVFSRLHERASGRAPAVRLRPAQPFEDDPPGGPPPELDLVVDAPTTSPRRGRPPHASVPPAPPRRPTAMPATIHPHPATAPDPEEDIAAHRAENPSPEPAGLPAETDTNPDPPVRDTRPEAPPPAADAGAAATTTVDEDGGLPRAPDVPQTRPNRTEQPTPPLPDVLTIVRDHVIPALVERRVIDRRDRPVVVQADRRDPSPSATAPVVSVDGVRTRAGDQPGPVPDGQLSPQHGTTPVAAPSVSVSIDRVVVTQAPPKQPPPQPVRPSPRPSVDHEAYLARRRAPR